MSYVITPLQSALKLLLFFYNKLLMLLVTAAILIMPTDQSLLIFLILFFILGFSTGSQTLAYALIVDVNAKDNVAKATSMLSFLSVGGGAIAQPLFGYIIQTTQNENYQNGMYIILFASLLALTLSIILTFDILLAVNNEDSDNVSSFRLIDFGGFLLQ